MDISTETGERDPKVPGPPTPRPLGLVPRQIMADIVGILDGVEFDFDNEYDAAMARSMEITTRLNLLSEAGAPGRMAMLEFLQQNVDYVIDLHSRDHKFGDNHLRFRVAEQLGETHTAEGEAAMRYLIRTSPILEEAVNAALHVKYWGSSHKMTAILSRCSEPLAIQNDSAVAKKYTEIGGLLLTEWGRRVFAGLRFRDM